MGSCRRLKNGQVVTLGLECFQFDAIHFDELHTRSTVSVFCTVLLHCFTSDWLTFDCRLTVRYKKVHIHTPLHRGMLYCTPSEHDMFALPNKLPLLLAGTLNDTLECGANDLLVLGVSLYCLPHFFL